MDVSEGRYKATEKWAFKLPRHKSGPLNQPADTADLDQVVVKKELSLYRGTSLVRNCLLLGPHNRPLPRALRCSWGGGAVSDERGTPVSGSLSPSL